MTAGSFFMKFKVLWSSLGFHRGSAVKHLPAMQEMKETGVPGSGRSPGGGHGNPLQYS